MTENRTKSENRRLIDDVDENLSAPLLEIILKYFVQDDEYCEELDACLYGEKSENPLVALPIEERRERIKNHYYNASRGYVVKTFTYRWLYKLYQIGGNAFLDPERRKEMDYYFGE